MNLQDCSSTLVTIDQKKNRKRGFRLLSQIANETKINDS